jgi:hypothetical protein
MYEVFNVSMQLYNQHLPCIVYPDDLVLQVQLWWMLALR